MSLEREGPRKRKSGKPVAVMKCAILHPVLFGLAPVSTQERGASFHPFRTCDMRGVGSWLKPLFAMLMHFFLSADR
jgi:hypothetical protein